MFEVGQWEGVDVSPDICRGISQEIPAVQSRRHKQRGRASLKSDKKRKAKKNKKLQRGDQSVLNNDTGPVNISVRGGKATGKRDPTRSEGVTSESGMWAVIAQAPEASRDRAVIPRDNAVAALRNKERTVSPRGGKKRKNKFKDIADKRVKTVGEELRLKSPGNNPESRVSAKESCDNTRMSCGRVQASANDHEASEGPIIKKQRMSDSISERRYENIKRRKKLRHKQSKREVVLSQSKQLSRGGATDVSCALKSAQQVMDKTGDGKDERNEECLEQSVGRSDDRAEGGVIRPGVATEKNVGRSREKTAKSREEKVDKLLEKHDSVGKETPTGKVDSSQGKNDTFSAKSKSFHFDVDKLKSVLSSTEKERVTSRVKKEKRMMTLGERMRERLNAARFRYLNERLYNQTGKESLKLFKKDPHAFRVYHEGFESQVDKWPSNPVTRVIQFIRGRSPSLVVADFGCGDAKIAQGVPNTVHSFDLVAMNDYVTSCDMAHVPLQQASVDLCVFCLSLMGTNLVDYLCEANRVLKKGGTLIVAEVVSRFDHVKRFVKKVEQLGFLAVNQDQNGKMFVWFEFKKVSNSPSLDQLPEIELAPCTYKKR